VNALVLRTPHPAGPRILRALFAPGRGIEYDMDSYVIQEDDNGIGWLYPQS
jgi:hypothetical protein